MSNLVNIFSKIKSTRSEDFEKKVLVNGNNRFRIIGDAKIINEHWFFDTTGRTVRSICTLDSTCAKCKGTGKFENKVCPDCEGTGLSKLRCPVCKEHSKAFQSLKYEMNTLDPNLITLYQRMTGQLIINGARANSNWKAKRRIVFNIIDRDDNWCRDNKHTKILYQASSSIGLSDAEKGVFKSQMQFIVEKYGEASSYDFNIYKMGKDNDTSYRADKDIESPLTVEEKTYKTYDLEGLLKPTEITLLTRWLTPETTITNTNVQETATYSNAVGNNSTINQAQPTVDMGKCPGCDKLIPSDNETCPYCGQDFSDI